MRQACSATFSNGRMIELVSSPQQVKFGQDKRDTLPVAAAVSVCASACQRRMPEEPFSPRQTATLA